MISNVSFGSTYRVNLKENSCEKLADFQRIQNDVCGVDNTTQIYSSWDRNNEHQTMVAKDTFDNYIETCLKSRNIVFHRYSKNDIYTENSIKARVIVPNDNYSTPRYLPNLIKINTKNFDKAFRNSELYLPMFDEINNPDRYSDFHVYLKSMEPIDAPEVYVREQNGKPVIDFQDGRHRYATMRNLGFKTIPVAMNAESLEVAKKYNLV